VFPESLLFRPIRVKLGFRSRFGPFSVPRTLCFLRSSYSISGNKKRTAEKCIVVGFVRFFNSQTIKSTNATTMFSQNGSQPSTCFFFDRQVPARAREGGGNKSQKVAKVHATQVTSPSRLSLHPFASIRAIRVKARILPAMFRYNVLWPLLAWRIRRILEP